MDTRGVLKVFLIYSSIKLLVEMMKVSIKDEGDRNKEIENGLFFSVFWIKSFKKQKIEITKQTPPKLILHSIFTLCCLVPHFTGIGLCEP